jgi:hypothetical protein
MTGGVPVLSTRASQSAHLEHALAEIEIDDATLTDPVYQDSIVATVRQAAGRAFDDLVHEVAQRLAEPPWFLLVRGLPASRATPLLVAVSATLGRLVEPSRRPWSRVVREIVPARDRAVEGRTLNEFLHTDGTDWPEPNDYTCLFCVRPDQSRDGRSRLLDAATLLEEASAGPGQRVVDRLAARALPWRIAEELGGGVHWEAAIDPATPHLRWLPHTVTSSPDDGRADMAAFEHLVEHCRGVVHIDLEAGDLLLLDNRRCLHARTPVRNPAASTRQLRRTKVMRRPAPR